ncbi:ribosomal protein S18-alanine N-acetyltransferase [Corynebacterium liangguodongii]|uniref:Ribosomal-protein-alanine N-acetyltransferase n=1 Tax=Corynebacterium liangguodongii TaxID=2079535 RepID=A0A2S0WCL3_9CORY|nr:ribosomal protein S18-alanine N-acetyltransferase [Corynebacterium liangguodongii]AWB83422.1 ribosomal-protein-alanine N-acetyltransferase [Corynebacterium liangguodongii]PWC00488.1 ribosomal-protein-alanine N-acetyltransferase [Corynebacterium liangguodongii]
MRFRELAAGDAAALAAIEADLFAGDAPWSRDVFLAELAHPYTFYVGAFEADELVGYAGLAMLGPREDPEFEVHTIGVARSHQGRGIGRALMDQLVHAADLAGGPMFLEVRTDNAAAIALYESYGFSILATRKAYYQPSGADAYSMMRHASNERDPGT